MGFHGTEVWPGPGEMGRNRSQEIAGREKRGGGREGLGGVGDEESSH